MNKLVGLLTVLISVNCFSKSKIGIIDDFTSYHGQEIFSIIDQNTNHKEIIKYQLSKSAENYYNLLEKAFNDKVDILNISSGTDSYDPKEFELLKKISNQGTIIVVASGNDNTRLGSKNQIFPCMFKIDNLFCIGASDKNKKAIHSNYGRGVSYFIDGSFSKGNMSSFSAPRFLSLVLNMKQLNINIPSFIEASSLNSVYKDEVIQIIDFKTTLSDISYQKRLNKKLR